MELIIFISVALIIGGAAYWYYVRNKPKVKEIVPMAAFHAKVANLEAEGKVEDKDFVVAIISLSEFNSKTPEEIKEWIEDKIGKEGVLSEYEVTDLGLQELTYATNDGDVDVFFLIVDRTSQEVIDWKPANVQIVSFPNDGKDRTREVREVFNNAPEGSTIHFLNDEIIVNGMLPEDAEKYRYGDVGEAGILMIEGKKNLTIESKAPSGKTVFKKTEEIRLPLSFHRNNNLASVLSHIKFKDCSGFVFKNIEFEGLNNIEGEKPGFAVYDKTKYAEHAFDLQGCDNMEFINCGADFIYGDGFYLRQGDRWNPVQNTNIRFKNFKSYWNGRQGGGIVQGENILIDGADIVTRRSGIDEEPNSDSFLINNVVIRNCKIRSQLLPFPMGGQGRVQNTLIENNEFVTGSPTTKVLGKAKLEGSRKNIIFRGNKRLNSFGSPSATYVFEQAENILIENNIDPITKNRSGKIIYLLGCKNVVIRNNDFPYAKFIVLLDTPISEVKVYGNKQPLQFQMLRDPSDYRSEYPLGNVIDIEEYDVEKNGEPDLSWINEINELR